MAVNFTGPLMITQMLRDHFIPGARIIHIGTNLAHRPGEAGVTEVMNLISSVQLLNIIV